MLNVSLEVTYPLYLDVSQTGTLMVQTKTTVLLLRICYQNKIMIWISQVLNYQVLFMTVPK